MNLGETSFSDIFGKFVEQLPNLATGYATYKLTSEQLKARRSQAQLPGLSYSPTMPYSYNPAYSPAYGGQIPAYYSQPKSDNTLLYLAIGGAALLLIIGMKKGR